MPGSIFCSHLDEQERIKKSVALMSPSSLFVMSWMHAPDKQHTSWDNNFGQHTLASVFLSQESLITVTHLFL